MEGEAEEQEDDTVTEERNNSSHGDSPLRSESDQIHAAGTLGVR